MVEFIWVYMLQTKNETGKKKNNRLMGIFFLLISILLIYFLFSSEQRLDSVDPALKSNIRDQDFTKSVNQHLQYQNIEMELERKKRELELKQLRDLHNQQTEIVENQKKITVDMPAYSSEESVSKILGKFPKSKLETESLNEWIQQELYDKEKRAQYTEEYKKEFARQFVENARRKGWKVILNDEYKVLSVTPLNSSKSGTYLFESGGGGAK